MTTKHTAANGKVFTEADIEAWAEQAEQGLLGAKFGTSSPGRPVSVGEGAKPLTIRLDAQRRAKLDKIAEDRHTTVSQLMRALIDTL